MSETSNEIRETHWTHHENSELLCLETMILPHHRFLSLRNFSLNSHEVLTNIVTTLITASDTDKIWFTNSLTTLTPTRPHILKLFDTNSRVASPLIHKFSDFGF